MPKSSSLYYGLFAALTLSLFVQVVMVIFLLVAVAIRSCRKRRVQVLRQRCHEIELRSTSPTSSNGQNKRSPSFSRYPRQIPDLAGQKYPLRSLKIEQMLHRGWRTRVHKGSMNGESCCIKCFESSQFDKYKREQEIYEILAVVGHPNIAQYFTADCMDLVLGFEYWLVFKFYTNGDLKMYLKDHILPLNTAFQMVVSLISGIAFLHCLVKCGNSIRTTGIAHGDLKPMNVLVKDNLSLCLTDMGTSVHCTEDGSVNHPHKLPFGTARYASPEVLEGKMDPSSFEEYKMSDIYSLSLIVYEIFISTREFGSPGLHPPVFDVGPNPTFDSMRKIIECGATPTIPMSWPSSMTSLLSSGWDRLPAHRPTIQEIDYCVKSNRLLIH